MYVNRQRASFRAISVLFGQVYVSAWRSTIQVVPAQSKPARHAERHDRGGLSLRSCIYTGTHQLFPTRVLAQLSRLDVGGARQQDGRLSYTCFKSPSCPEYPDTPCWVDASTHEPPPARQGSFMGCVALPCSVSPPGREEEWRGACASHLNVRCAAECEHNTYPTTGKTAVTCACLNSTDCPGAATSCWVDATTHEPPSGQSPLGCSRPSWCSSAPPGQHEVWKCSCAGWGLALHCGVCTRLREWRWDRHSGVHV